MRHDEVVVDVCNIMCAMCRQRPETGTTSFHLAKAINIWLILDELASVEGSEEELDGLVGQ